jgi:hypothetical protein
MSSEAWTRGLKSQNWPRDGCGILLLLKSRHSESLFDHGMERSEERGTAGKGVGVCCAPPIVSSGIGDAAGGSGVCSLDPR